MLNYKFPDIPIELLWWNLTANWTSEIWSKLIIMMSNGFRRYGFGKKWRLEVAKHHICKVLSLLTNKFPFKKELLFHDSLRFAWTSNLFMCLQGWANVCQKFRQEINLYIWLLYHCDFPLTYSYMFVISYYII